MLYFCPSTLCHVLISPVLSRPSLPCPDISCLLTTLPALPWYLLSSPDPPCPALISPVFSRPPHYPQDLSSHLPTFADLSRYIKWYPEPGRDHRPDLQPFGRPLPQQTGQHGGGNQALAQDWKRREASGTHQRYCYWTSCWYIVIGRHVEILSLDVMYRYCHWKSCTDIVIRRHVWILSLDVMYRYCHWTSCIDIVIGRHV